jgi:hypothetical protein
VLSLQIRDPFKKMIPNTAGYLDTTIFSEPRSGPNKSTVAQRSIVAQKSLELSSIITLKRDTHPGYEATKILQPGPASHFSKTKHSEHIRNNLHIQVI